MIVVIAQADVVATGIRKVLEYGLVGLLFAGSLVLLHRFIVVKGSEDLERERAEKDRLRADLKAVYEDREQLLRDTITSLGEANARWERLSERIDAGIGSIADRLDALEERDERRQDSHQGP